MEPGDLLMVRRELFVDLWKIRDSSVSRRGVPVDFSAGWSNTSGPDLI